MVGPADNLSASPPPRLVDDNGQVQFGIYEAPLREVNLDDARITWRGIPLPAPMRQLRLKEWQHFALITPDLFCGFAIVDAKYLGQAWCRVVDQRGRVNDFEVKREGLRPELRIARNLWDEHSWFRGKGLRIEIHNHLLDHQHRAEIALAPSDTHPGLRASLCMHHDLEHTRPLVVALPVGGGAAMYSHKVALPVSGEVWLGGDRLNIDPANSCVLLDIHKAHYPRRTWWQWATFGGHDSEGRLIALNLTANIVKSPRKHHENALFYDGALHRLSPPRFEYCKDDPNATWRITTEEGEVELEFQPAGLRSENLRLGLVESVFTQCHGRFSGRIKAPNQAVDINHFFGLAEDHRALW